MQSNSYFITLTSEDLQAKIREIADKLAGTYSLDLTNLKPHITLLGPFMAHHETMESSMAVFNDMKCIDVILEKICIFDNGVVYLNVDPVKQLKMLRKKLLNFMAKHRDFSENIEYKPWIPHATLVYSTPSVNYFPFDEQIHTYLDLVEVSFNMTKLMGRSLASKQKLSKIA